jgi:membrane-bound lytic murein transglycosylase B
VAAAVGLCGATRPQAQQAPTATGVDERPTFEAFIARVREDAIGRGISEETASAALDALTPLEVVVQRDRAQAEFVETVDQYIARRLTPRFVRTARTQVDTHRVLLQRIESRYGVPGAVLVAVWGLESNFGRFSGVRPVPQALATLAWEGRRGQFFREELFAALAILDEGAISPGEMKGSWAGAMGQPQFMPSSYLDHAVDFDDDGRRDIWTSTPDVLASIAHYLKNHGWQAGERWGRPVRVGPAVAEAMATVPRRDAGCRATRDLTEARGIDAWQRLGVRTAEGGALPGGTRAASLMKAGRHHYLVYRNYEAVLGYNCAHAYALTVTQLAERIRGR